LAQRLASFLSAGSPIFGQYFKALNLRLTPTSKLFTGSYRTTVEHISVPRVLAAVIGRLMK
jgi:hypothetical protein